MSKIIQHNKENWCNQVEAHLSQLGFYKIDDNTFERVIKQQQGGQVVIINNQRTELPGQIITVTNTVYYNGDGWSADEDESNKREFTQVVFETTLDGELRGEAEFCFYWDDIQYFIDILNQIF